MYEWNSSSKLFEICIKVLGSAARSSLMYVD